MSTEIKELAVKDHLNTTKGQAFIVNVHHNDYDTSTAFSTALLNQVVLVDKQLYEVTDVASMASGLTTSDDLVVYVKSIPNEALGRELKILETQIHPRLGAYFVISLKENDIIPLRSELVKMLGHPVTINGYEHIFIGFEALGAENVYDQVKIIVK